MKHQQVSVDFWAMGQTMLTYAFMTLVGWMMMRLFNTVFTLPQRMRQQQDSIQATLQELQRRYPDLNVTEEDLKEAEKEINKWTMINDENVKSKVAPELEPSEEPAVEEDKKTI